MSKESIVTYSLAKTVAWPRSQLNRTDLLPKNEMRVRWIVLVIRPQQKRWFGGNWQASFPFSAGIRKDGCRGSENCHEIRSPISRYTFQAHPPQVRLSCSCFSAICRNTCSSVWELFLFSSFYSLAVGVSALLATIIIALTLFNDVWINGDIGCRYKAADTGYCYRLFLGGMHLRVNFISWRSFSRNWKLLATKRSLFTTRSSTPPAIPVLYTSLTTAAGMLAFCSSELAPIVESRLVLAQQRCLSPLCFTWVVIPICIRLTPLKPKNAVRPWSQSWWWPKRRSLPAGPLR